MQNISSCQISEGQIKGARRIYREATPTELIYIATKLIVVSRSSIDGAVSRKQFDTAVGHLEARYGILRSVVEGGQFVERTDDRSSVESWLSPETCSADTMYATLLNAELDTQDKIYSIHVIADADKLDVFILSSHAVTDATSLIELHSCLAHICDCVVRGVAPVLEEQPFPNPLDAAVNQKLASLPAERAGASPSYPGVFAEIPMRAPDSRPVNHRLERFIIEAKDMHRIHAASHAHGSSVHSLLMAAFALAIRDVADGEPRQILMRSSVDIRRRLDPPVSTELVLTAITGHITPLRDLDQPLFDLAKLVFDDLHEGAASGSLFRDYVNYPKAFGSGQQPPVALNISDMQTVAFRWPMERLKVTGFEYACGWLKKFPNLSVSVYDGKLIANTAYVEEFADPAVMRAISEGVVRRLLSAC
jgi:phthiocerol/phthiodiolone dimycocerosyl transferase-like enzyme